MIDFVGHRGPDEAGLFMDDHVALGVARLRIVDAAGSVQPMSDASGRWWLAYNGEVYNFSALRIELEAMGHSFATRGDTEVVLRAWIEWGTESVKRLEGGFAFAIYDRQNRAAFLVRDRFGKRPLFYRRMGPAIEFGSEIKVFLARDEARLEWDLDALPSVFSHWTVVDGDTPFLGVAQVRAGSILRIDAAGSVEIGYGGFPQRRASSVPFDAAARETAARLSASVRRRLPTDVKSAVLLSGGLDSSILTHLARVHHRGRVQTFSIGFANPAFDESECQDLVVNHFDVDNTRVRIGANAMAESFTSALWHAEVPQFTMGFVPMFLLARRIANEGFRVILSGEGADEVFLGYDLFKETRLREQWHGLSRSERKARLLSLHPYLKAFSEPNLPFLEAIFGRSVDKNFGILSSHALRIEVSRVSCRLLARADDPTARLHKTAVAAGLANWNPVDAAQWLEVQTLLQGYLLSSQGDRMTFAHGLESRNPFLAPDVVALAAALPETFHLGEDGSEKRLLKRAFAGVIPNRILGRPKQPYRAPIIPPFVRSGSVLRPRIAEALRAEALARVTPISRSFAVPLAERVLRGHPLSPQESQAFLLLASTVELDRLFVRGEGRQIPRIRPPLARRVIATSDAAC